MGRWEKFRRLSPEERELLIRALFLLPLTAAALRLLGFRRWQAALARLAGAPTPLGDARANSLLENAQLAARMVHAASENGFRRASCLEQSLVLQWLLSRQGIPAQLRIGVRKQQQHFEAHAWVESGGAVLNDGDDAHRHYTPFDGSIAAAEAQPR